MVPLLPIQKLAIQWNPSIMATIPWGRVALSQGLICTIGDSASKVAFIEGCPHIRGGLYEGFHCSLV